MKVHKWKDIRAKSKLTAKDRAGVDQLVEQDLLLLKSLREVREMAGKNQNDVAAILEKTQGEISSMENRGDWLLSTLREYVKALGGELEVVAVLGDKRLRLRGV